MIYKILKWSCLALLSGSVLNCASRSYDKMHDAEFQPLSGDIEAARFPEVILRTTDGQKHQGKMIRLQGESLIFAPSPYWNVDRIPIRIGDILSFEVTRAKKGVIYGGSWGMSLAATTVGLLGLAGGKYDFDFRLFAAATPIAGLVGGLIGAMVGGIVDLSTPKQIDLSGLTPDKKGLILAAVMTSGR